MTLQMLTLQQLVTLHFAGLVYKPQVLILNQRNPFPKWLHSSGQKGRRNVLSEVLGSCYPLRISFGFNVL